MSIPWAEKYRPQKVEDVCLEASLMKTLMAYDQNKEIPNHLLLIGSAGIGKTTIAKILARNITDDEYLYIPASKNRGIDVLRNEISSFCSYLSANKKIVVLDEADGFSTIAQDALRNVLDEFITTTIFILTANYENRIIDPIKSRCITLEFGKGDKGAVAKRCLTILKNESVKFEDKDGLKKLVNKFYPDIRKIVVALQRCSVAGTFIYDDTAITNTEEADKLIKYAKEGNIKDIVKELLGAGVDYVELYRILFDRSAELHAESDVMIKLEVSEYLYRHAIVPQPEINFKACLIKIYERINASGKPSFV